eukprot:5138722-Pyramimonas_sp.AAC.1
MSYIAVRHSTRRWIIRSANLKYLDARSRSHSRAGSEQLFVLCQFFKDGDDFLDVTRAADEVHSCLAQHSERNYQER